MLDNRRGIMLQMRDGSRFVAMYPGTSLIFSSNFFEVICTTIKNPPLRVAEIVWMQVCRQHNL